MASQSDVRTVEPQSGKVASKRRFDLRDFDYVADFMIAEYEKRKKDRKDRERCWAEIDRQIAMEPSLAFKKLPNGTIDPRKAWMAEVELPLQAQALEVLTADARRLLFARKWFGAHSAVTDEYLRKVDFQSIILGDESEVPSQINQDNADKLVEGFLLHLFRQQVQDEDFFTRMDRINAESFKYAMGIGRARRYKRDLYVKTPAGMRKQSRTIPVLVPCSVKNVYLDDPKPSIHSAQLLEPAHIACDHIRLENLLMAANAGSTDPDDEDGGWMPANVKNLVEDDKGYVTLLEMEGDIVVPRKTVRSVVIPGAIVTIAIGGKDAGGKVSRGVIRFRFRKSQESSYLLFPYHYEGADDRYAASPLMKGRPVQMTATDATNRFLDSAALKIGPPVGYDRTDMVFAQSGGPQIYPYAVWGTTDPVKVYEEIGGDPGAMAAGAAQFTNMYAELSGVLPARLGAQTVSHTTAFAKDAEITRGASRTVDYVDQIGKGPMTRWLDMAYRMGREAVGSGTAVFFIDAYGGYVEVRKDQLPEMATFEWFGAGGPAEEQQKRQNRLQSLGLALQMDQLAVATGRKATVNIQGAIAEVLRDGGWTDVDVITDLAGTGAAAMPPSPAQGPATAAVQQLPGMAA
jgi:hypothetical protein